MKNLLAILLWVAMAAPSIGAVDRTMPDTTTLSLRGTLETYDSTTGILSVMTRRGPVRLALVPTTRIRQGRREIDAAMLEKLHGYRAVVRYSESVVGRVLQSIHVLEKDETLRQ